MSEEREAKSEGMAPEKGEEEKGEEKGEGEKGGELELAKKRDVYQMLADGSAKLEKLKGLLVWKIFHEDELNFCFLPPEKVKNAIEESKQNGRADEVFSYPIHSQSFFLLNNFQIVALLREYMQNEAVEKSAFIVFERFEKKFRALQEDEELRTLLY